MPDNTTKVPGKTEKTPPSTWQPWRPFESLRREVDRPFDDFSGGIWRSPFGRSFFDVEPFRPRASLLRAQTSKFLPIPFHGNMMKRFIVICLNS
jgi:hypothetical protein